MEDFLKGREVVSRSNPPETAASSTATLPPLDQAEPAEPPQPVAKSQQDTGEHGTRVETVVEHGRVTRLIVTCTCGNVTEIECRY
jgi:hypothetical protein